MGQGAGTFGNHAGRRRRARSSASGLCVVLALVFVVSLPASAHDDDHGTLLQADSTSGPFVVSVWAVEQSSDRIELYVVSRGEVDPGMVEVIYGGGQSAELVREPAQRTWAGTIVHPAEGESLEFRLTGDGGEEGSLLVSLPAADSLVMSSLVVILLAQGFVTLGWLLMRAPAVWGIGQSRSRRNAEPTARAPKAMK